MFGDADFTFVLVGGYLMGLLSGIVFDVIRGKHGYTSEQIKRIEADAVDRYKQQFEPKSVNGWPLWLTNGEPRPGTIKMWLHSFGNPPEWWGLWAEGEPTPLVEDHCYIIKL